MPQDDVNQITGPYSRFGEGSILLLSGDGAALLEEVYLCICGVTGAPPSWDEAESDYRCSPQALSARWTNAVELHAATNPEASTSCTHTQATARRTLARRGLD